MRKISHLGITMQFKLLKSDKYLWTQHAQWKMRQYGLSPQRVIRVIRNPERVEEGIVEKTIAVMQPASVKYKNFKKTWSQEFWAMYQLRKSGAIFKSQFPISNKIHPVKSSPTRGAASLQFNRVKIISVWRYPGMSSKNNPIPEEILEKFKRPCDFLLLTLWITFFAGMI